MSRRALIVGITGQDGSYLAKFLLKKNYIVFGGTRNSSAYDISRLKKLNIDKEVKIISIAPNDIRSVIKAIDLSKPDEIYYLAGLTSVGLSFEQPLECMESISGGTINFLEAIKLLNPNIRFFNAGSSECFGNTNKVSANEETAFNPRSPYAIAKSTAFWQVASYRESYNLFCCTGILGNHESPLRHERFVSQKIIKEVKKIEKGISNNIRLGNINIFRDWGLASEYIEAMYLMLNNKIAEDYVIATGESNSLEQFVKLAFEYINLDYKKYIVIDKNYFRPSDIKYSFLDPSKIKKELGWVAQTKISKLVDLMYKSI